MPWFTKRKKEEGKFRPYSRLISACFGRFRRVSVISATGWCGPILAESARFGANRSRFGTNRAASSRIEPSQRESEKKKKKTQTQTDAQATASDAGAAPLVPPLCFLDGNSHVHQEVLNPRPFPPPRSLWRKCHWARDHLLSNQAKNKNKNKK